MALLADVVLVLHLLFIVFVGLGGFLVLHWPRIALLHLPAAVWGAAIELGGWTCPLTPVEQLLRRAGGDPSYSGGFVEHYLVPLVYPEGLGRPHQLALGVGVIVVNLAAYALVARRHRGARGPEA